MKAAIPEDLAYGDRPHARFLSPKLAPFCLPLRSNANAFERGDESQGNDADARSKMPQRWEGFSYMATPMDHFVNGSSKGNNCGLMNMLQRNRQMDLRVSDANRDAEASSSREERRKTPLSTNGGPPHGIPSCAGNESSNEAADKEQLRSSSSDEAVRTNAKRIRPSSPGGQHPSCQVDDCQADLKQAKDYHRRHKVCEAHSKAPCSLVLNKKQRFCQQCSRFHLLEEFDEGKRSCRRRLAGHNKRRRKAQADLFSNVVSALPAAANGSANNVLSIVATLQPSKVKENAGMNDKPKLHHHSLSRDGIGHQSLQLPAIQESQVKIIGPLIGFRQDALSFIQNLCSLPGKSMPGQVNSTHATQPVHSSNQNSISPPGLGRHEDHVGNARSGNVEHPFHDKPCEVDQEPNPTNVSRPIVTRQYLSDTGFNTEESDPVSSSSPDNEDDARSPAERNFFPTVSGSGFHKGTVSRTNESADSCSHLGISLNLSSYNEQIVEVTPLPSDSPDSGSDRSAASSSADGQEELSGRIFFKLCDPTCLADLPQNHRSQLQEWLSVMPCFMEGYIRPGCVLLTLFLSMPRRRWKELVANLRENVKRLVQSSVSPSDTWRKGRILVQLDDQRVLIVNGKVKRIRCLKTTNKPILKSVRPVAVIAGQESTLTVCGYNLVPQTKILCVYQERYIVHEVLSSSSGDGPSAIPYEKEGCWRRQVHKIQFPGGPPNVLGRLFIEVERDLAGDIFPVIVADAQICSELRTLEEELDDWQHNHDENILSYEIHVNKIAEAMNFLHELGWIFQSTSYIFGQSGGSLDISSQMTLLRFKGLLNYAVERDWCAVVKKLLDLMFHIGYKEKEELLRVLSEVNLIHEAVKRRCTLMVKLLLQYQPDGIIHSRYNGIFTPVMKGEAGITPLHVAASMFGAEEMIDMLTSDPNEVGLLGWKSVTDNEGRTPEWHAQNSGNIGYLKLIEEKLLRRQSLSVNITVLDSAEEAAQKDYEKQEEISKVDTVALHVSSIEPTRSSVACRNCRAVIKQRPFWSSSPHMRMYRPLMMMTVTIAAMCAIIAILFKGPPRLISVSYSLKWDQFQYGSL